MAIATKFLLHLTRPHGLVASISSARRGDLGSGDCGEERALGAECGVGGRGELAALGAETVGSLVKSQWRYSRGLTLRLRQEPMMEKKVAA
jgi:hypothetical protein